MKQIVVFLDLRTGEELDRQSPALTGLRDELTLIVGFASTLESRHLLMATTKEGLSAGAQVSSAEGFLPV